MSTDSQLYAPCTRIGGKDIRTGTSLVDVLNPSTGERLGKLPLVGPAELESAIASACEGFDRWKQASVTERADVLHRTAHVLSKGRDALAHLISLELGKPKAEAQREADTASEMFLWAAEETRRTYGRVIPARERGMQQHTVWQPVGPVAGFSGWNAPAITPARKISGALAAGCSIVMKPSEETPATALFLMDALEEAGLPPNVCNIVFGDAPLVANTLLDDSRIRMMTFTGSTQIGKQLAARSLNTMKRMTLELGGYAPVLVFPDVDVEKVAAGAAAAAFRNSGQVCTSPTRFFVHESIYENFLKALSNCASALHVGDAQDPATQMGPLANARGLQRMSRLVDDALEKGASVAAGGTRIEQPGFYFRPTILADLSDECALANEEPFGPVKGVSAFGSLDHALACANRLPYGLAAYAWTNDLRTAGALADGIVSGSLAINHWRASLPETPFGGLKESGFGLEGGTEGIQAFMQQRFISTNAI